MARIFTLVLGLVLAVVACQEKDAAAGSGSDPLDRCVISDSVQPGMEAVVQWNGFESSAALCLKDAEGNESPVEVMVVTSSGLIFRVPAGVEAGTYSLVLRQSGKSQELGTIEVLEADLPVTGLDCPAAVEPGKDFVIEGVGLSEEFILIVSDGSRRVVLDCVMESSSRMRVSTPDELPAGTYALYLSDGNDEWLLQGFFRVAVRKALRMVSFSTPYMGNTCYRVCYEVERTEGSVAAVVVSAAYVENEEVVTEEFRDRYVLGADGIYRAEGGVSSSNNIEFGYVLDNAGKILYADVLRFSSTNPEGTMRTFTYVYDQDGAPGEVTFELNGDTYSMQKWFYENGNVVETKTPMRFVYEDESLTANPFAPDLAIGYFALTDMMEPFIYVPYLVGEHPFVSRLLPSGLHTDSGNGTFSLMSLTYMFDEDDYVSSASWNGGLFRMDFAYMTP